MQYAVNILEQDKSLSVAGSGNIQAGIVIQASKGVANKPIQVNSQNFIQLYGTPNPKKSVNHYSALFYLANSQSLWVARTIHELQPNEKETATNRSAKFSCALSRFIVNPLPQEAQENPQVDLPLMPYTIGGKGLTQAQIDSFTFPLYSRNRQYSQLKSTTLIAPIDNSSTMLVATGTELKVGDTFSFGLVANLNDQSPIFEVTDLLNTSKQVSSVTTSVEVTAPIGSVVVEVVLNKQDSSNPTYQPVKNNPTLIQNAQGTTDILLSDSDYIINDGNHHYALKEPTGTYSTTFTPQNKSLYTYDFVEITLSNPTTQPIDTQFALVTQSETYFKDVLLFYSQNQGQWGDNVSVEISPSPNYPDQCVIIKTFENGIATGESFEVSFDYFVNGLGVQMYVEEVINGNSNYINVKHNKQATKPNGTPELPLCNNYAVWQQNPQMIFSPTQDKTLETLLQGDNEVSVTQSTGLEIGNIITFGNLTSQYKITNISQVQNTTSLTLDRGIVDNSVPKGSVINLWDKTEYYPLTKLPQPLPNYSIGKSYKIGENNGTLLDCGANLFIGGDDGSAPTTGDYINTLQTCFGNKLAISVNILLSGGEFATPYAQALDSLASSRGDCFAYLSNNPQALQNTQPDQASIQFRQSQNIDSSYSCTMADWVWIYDNYNKIKVKVSTDGLAGALQSLASQGGVWGEVVAGWNKGVLFNVLQPVVVWTEQQIVNLLNAQLNPVKQSNTLGLSIWGNKTNLAQQSYMQMRNVRFLLIQMTIELQQYLESIMWSFNDKATRSLVCSVVKDTFWNNFSQVLNNLEVFDTTTNADIDAGNMKIYIGIQPKGVVETIYATIGVFSNSQSISISTSNNSQ